MESNYRNASDGTITFLPHRLNRQPVVVRGLTADELWICTGLSAVGGALLGVPAAWLASSLAMIPTAIVLAIAIGLFVGGGLLRRQKRGRPETWLYRQINWWMANNWPGLAGQLGAGELIIRSGYWTTRRGGV